MPLFQSGFGDRVYPVYYGFGSGSNICCLAVQFIDMALAYGNDEENGEEK